jgi:hypothetical protein
MTKRRAVAVCSAWLVSACGVLVLTTDPVASQTGGAIAAAFEQYWAAQSPEEASTAAEAVIASGVSFHEARQRLARGRTYLPDVPRGIVPGVRRAGDIEFPYTVQIPENYDASRRYQVRIQLHGGVMRPEAVVRGSGGVGNLAGAEQIYVLPVAWRDAPWWSERQLANLRKILDAVKRRYNVDENRVVLAGVSDGATGAFYAAMRDTTPYASFLPLNGFIMILGQPSVGLRDPLFPNNLRNKPFFIVNGGRDRLYPTQLVEPYVRHLSDGGVDVTYRPQPDGEHNTAWWPEVRDEFEAFVAAHARNPHPASVTWQATAGDPTAAGEDMTLVNRAHWIVVDGIAPPRVESPLPDLNERSLGTEPNFGIRATGMRITSVLPGSSAEALGLLPDDLVRSVNGRQLPGGVPLLDLLSIERPGNPLTFRVTRAGSDMELTGTYQPTMMPRTQALFPRRGPSGRVDAMREGNTVRATTRGVSSFTVLLSPDVFDFEAPVTIVANDRVVFEGRVEPSLATLMRWAARDNDRTMLYGAEVTTSVEDR